MWKLLMEKDFELVNIDGGVTGELIWKKLRDLTKYNVKNV